MDHYWFYLRDVNGIGIGRIVHYLHFKSIDPLNDPGSLEILLPADHPVLKVLPHRAIVELWRRNDAVGLPPYCERRVLYLGKIKQGRYHCKLLCAGPLWFLKSRTIAYPSGVANRTLFTAIPAETIIKTLAQYNAWEDATTANDRLIDAVISRFEIQADGGNGNITNWACFDANLLDTTKALCTIGGGDVDIVYEVGPNVWMLNWYTGQRGADRTATVVFSEGLHNMKNPTLEDDRRREITVAILGGRGTGAARTFVVRTGPDYSPLNHVEAFFAALNETAGTMAAYGDHLLEKLRARKRLTFTPIQGTGREYGKDYHRGDLVQAVFGGQTFTQKITEIVIEPGAPPLVRAETQHTHDPAALLDYLQRLEVT